MNDTALHALDMVEAIEENNNNDIATNKGISLKGLNEQWVTLNQEQADTLYSIVMSDFVPNYNGAIIPINHSIRACFRVVDDYTLQLAYEAFSENKTLGRGVLRLSELYLSDDEHPRLWALVKYAIKGNTEPF